tara:strand:- start:877 stop:1212 length:336 start_codon:yes stop_codon:yes gene_type:complete
MIKHKQIGAALEALITLKSAVRAVQIRESSPTRASCRAQRNRHTWNVKSVGQEFPTVENLPPACCDHTVTGLPVKIILEPIKIKLTTIVLKVLLKNSEPALVQFTTDSGSN